MAILGTGTVAPGMACDCAGTSEAINVCARPDYLIPRTATVGAAGRESLPTGAVSLLLLPHIIPPYRNLAAMLPATGRLFERYRRSYVPEEGDYRGLVERLARLPFAASASVFPAPPAKGPDGRGGSGARDGDWNFASEAAAPDEIGRAVLEAIGFTARMGIDLLGSAGLRPAELRVSGGQSRNEAWNRLKADLAGIPLAIPELPDGELSGDLCAALVALGEASSFKEAASRSVRIAQTYEPDQAARGANEDAYRRWLERGAREEGEGS
jgi:xylulokinase